MNSGSAASTDEELYANWLPAGVWQGLISGYYDGGLDGQGDYGGNYWSSTANSIDHALYLLFGDGFVYPGHMFDKYYGYAVRCAI